MAVVERFKQESVYGVSTPKKWLMDYGKASNLLFIGTILERKPVHTHISTGMVKASSWKVCYERMA